MPEPRKPQDRQPKQTATADEHPPGWDLLKPFADVPVWDQTDLLEIVKPLMADVEEVDDTDEDGLKVRALDFDTRIVGELAKRLEGFAVDSVAYRKFVSGPGALERAINLGVAYAGQLGESAPSTAG